MNENIGIMELKKMGRRLAELYNRQDTLSDTIQIVEGEIAETKLGEELSYLRNQLSSSKTESTSLEIDAKAMTLGLAAELKMKSPAPCFGVRKSTTFKVLNDTALIWWCKDHLPDAVIETYDKNLVKNYVLGLPEDKRPGFVDVVVDEYGTPTISPKEKIIKEYLPMEAEAGEEGEFPF